jgi:hypothetical protein
MITLDDVSAAVTIGEGYFSELLAKAIADLKTGKIHCLPKKLFCLNRLIKALKWDIADEVLDDTTIAIYELLLIEIGTYAGAGSVVDPNVSIPGLTIIVVTGPGTVVRIHKDQDDLIEDGEGTGNWYLPFLDQDDAEFGDNIIPIELTTDGVTLDIQLNNNFDPPRLYGFANNQTQSIILTVY